MHDFRQGFGRPNDLRHASRRPQTLAHRASVALPRKSHNREVMRTRGCYRIVNACEVTGFPLAAGMTSGDFSVCFAPTLSRSDIDPQRHGEFRGVLHTYADAFTYRVQRILAHLEDEFVVHL